MECRLVIKDYNSLYIIYLTKLYKVLVGVIFRIIIIFNFYIYKELFNLTFKIFYPFILNQEALKIGYNNFLIPNCRNVWTEVIWTRVSNSHPYGDSLAPPYLGTAILTILCFLQTEEQEPERTYCNCSTPQVIPTLIFRILQ